MALGEQGAPLVEPIARDRLFSEAETQGEPCIIPLSILDNTVVRFALTSAVWFFDRPSGRSDSALSPEALSRSLKKTLNFYPAWAGQLQWLPYEPSQGQLHGRTCVSYGSASDPGIEVITAQSPRTLPSILPDSKDRTRSGVWRADDFPSAQLLCPTALALYNSSEYLGLPSVSIQITSFACGGVSIALRIVHPIADATAMFQFAKDWAAIHRAMLDDQVPPAVCPLFDPRLLDKAAMGCVASNPQVPDPEILRTSHSLPMVKYDWWVSAPDCPPPMIGGTRVPPELEGTDLGLPGNPMPWREWDVFAPVDHHLLYFTPAEVQYIWEEASVPGSRVSRLDALLAFVWRLVVRAREMEHDTDPVHMIVTVGARSRVAPPLPDAFLGSPIMLARVTLTGEEIAASTFSGAIAIRSTVSQFTPEAVSAFLHDVAHEMNPQRFWRAFLGRRHSIVTSWQNLDAYGLDFGGGAPPRFVDAVMPSMDGCIHVMEAGPAKGAKGGRWYDESVCVSLRLRSDVVERLLNDPELRKHRTEEISG
ncbi:transferase family-domain-containing protein [Trametes meyenii]|nr:transferase family-domain-containing protein [Trametes meyenii]